MSSSSSTMLGSQHGQPSASDIHFRRQRKGRNRRKTKPPGQGTNLDGSPITQEQQQQQQRQRYMEQMAPLERVLQRFERQQVDDGIRLEVIEYLEQLVGEWNKALLSLPRPFAQESNVWHRRTPPTIVSFGSYRLGVTREESDLDLLMVAPPHIARGDFFTSWVKFLSKQDRIQKVHAIPEAYTPVLRLEIDSISVDMLFARLADASRLQAFHHERASRQSRALAKHGPGNPPATTLPQVMIDAPPSYQRQEYFVTDADLIDQDEAGIRSLNGARVSQDLLAMVPDLHKFQVVLRAVKEWAVCKGIYSNVLGFLGGVNWAILVAWVCRFYPHTNTATPAELFIYFFSVFPSWVWRMPLALKPVQMQPPPGVRNMRVWNPAVNPRDQLDLMPILTPAYPTMNSAYNVGLSQLRRMRSQLKKAWTALDSLDFDQLFKPCDYFAQNKEFLQVTIRATNQADFVVWFRWVESRLRFLLSNLETPEIRAIPQSRFYMQAYNVNGQQSGTGRSTALHAPQEAYFFIALQASKKIDLNSSIRFLTSDFIYQTKAWEKRDEKTMNVSIDVITKEALPSCCFRPDDDDDDDDDEWENATNQTLRSLDNDSHSGKITPRTSQGSEDDDSLVSDCSGLPHDFAGMRKCRVNTSAVESW